MRATKRVLASNNIETRDKNPINEVTPIRPEAKRNSACTCSVKLGIE
jgi:hypothetical protein